MRWLPVVAALAFWFLGIQAEAVLNDVQEAVAPVWSTWKDGDKRAWLAANGILNPDVKLEEDEQGPEGLNRLLENYFFEEDEAVYSNWKTSELQMWLISHQFVPREEAYSLSRPELLERVASNYLGAEMSSCHGWTPSEVREWLDQNGHGEEAKDVPDDKNFDVMMKYFNRGSDALAQFMLWPDARLRAFLRARGVSEPKKAKRQRPDLVHMVRVRSKQKPTSTEDLVKQLQNVLISGADWSEEQLLAALTILGGTKHRGVGKAMQEASKFARTADTKEKHIKEEQAKLRAEENEL